MFHQMKSSLSLFFEKIQLRYLFSRDKLSVVLHTSCACCVRVLIVVALYNVRWKEDSSIICSLQ